jgi:hypothetical protein
MSGRHRAIAALAAALLGVLALPLPVAAHALGQVFQLPIPSWMYFAGAGTAVAVSFAVSAVVFKVSPAAPRYPKLRMPALPSRALSWVLAAIGLAWWYGAIVTAFVIGGDTPLPTVLFWIFIWAGVPIASAVFGNPWPSVSPFRTTFEILERLARFGGLDRLDLGMQMPAGIGRWPAVFLLFAGIWSELVLPGATETDIVAFLLIGYTLIQLAGMGAFGRVAWLRNAELFEVLFGWFGRIGPIGRRVTNPAACAGCSERCNPERCIDCPECAVAADATERRPELRPWFTGLTEVRRGAWSDAAFILLALSGVTYDGLRETNLWADVANWLFPHVHPPLDPFRAILAVETLGLLGLWLGFFVLFVIVAAITRGLSEHARLRGGLGSVVGAYAATLLPIAAGYMIAHYLTLVIQGAIWLPELVRNPLSLVAPTLDTLNAGLVWYLSVGAIVVGHIAAIALSHRIALRDAPGRAVRAGIPLALLMIGYTVFSLWIIAQPITLEPGQAPPVSQVLPF